MKSPVPPAAPNPQPLRDALAKADKAKADLAEFKDVTIPRWKREYEELVKAGDPHDPIHVRDAAHARERVEMAFNYLRKFERELTPVMIATLRAVQDFDRSFLAASNAEYTALLEEITAALRPYCRDVERLTETPGVQMVDGKGASLASKGIERIMVNTAQGVARGCTILSYIPLTFEALAAHFDPDYAHSLTLADDHLTWREVPTFEESAVAAGFGPDGRAVVHPIMNQLGGFNMNDVSLAGHATHRAPLPGETFRAQPAATALAVQANANFERIVRGRAAALLARYEDWRANGGQFAPNNFADLGPLMLPKAAAPLVPGGAAAKLGGTAKDMRAQGGHGAPVVDLQGMKL